MKHVFGALILASALVGMPSGIDAQSTLQAGDSVRFQVQGAPERTGRVVSAARDSITVRAGGERRYALSELHRVRRLERRRGAREDAFWKGTLIGGALGGVAGLTMALNNMPSWGPSHLRGPMERDFVLAMTTGGAMLGGLVVGIAGALLTSEHEWVDVEIDGRTRDRPARYAIRFFLGWR